MQWFRRYCRELSVSVKRLIAPKLGTVFSSVKSQRQRHGYWKGDEEASKSNVVMKMSSSFHAFMREIQEMVNFGTVLSSGPFL